MYCREYFQLEIKDHSSKMRDPSLVTQNQEQVYDLTLNGCTKADCLQLE